MEREGLVLFQQVLRELQRQDRCLLGQLTQPLLTVRIEQGTTTHKAVIAVVEQHLLLGRKLTVMAVNIFDAFKQPFVQADVIGMLCQQRTHLLCQLVHGVIRLSRQQIEEHRRGSRQQVIISLAVLFVVNRDDGIIKRRRLLAVYKLVYLLILTAHALHEGLIKVLQSDTVKGHRLVRRIIFSKKRINSIFLFNHNILCSFSLQSYNIFPIIRHN